MLIENLADALVSMVPGRPNALAHLRTLYADDIVFQDPIQTVRGIAAFMEMNEKLMSKLRSLEWTINAVSGDDTTGIIEWTMHAKSKLGPSLAVDGLTRAQFRAGLVVDHRDYWDLSEMIASAVPGGTFVRSAVRRLLA
jgi:hypothetical protein